MRDNLTANLPSLSPFTFAPAGRRSPPAIRYQQRLAVTNIWPGRGRGEHDSGRGEHWTRQGKTLLWQGRTLALAGANIGPGRGEHYSGEDERWCGEDERRCGEDERLCGEDERPCGEDERTTVWRGRTSKSHKKEIMSLLGFHINVIVFGTFVYL